jgi:hypothetical protein
MVRVRGCIAVLSCAVWLSAGVPAEARQETDQEARAILKQLIEINTTDSIGNVSELPRPWPSAFARRALQRRM